MKNEGFKGFYKGLDKQLIGIFLSYWIYFLFYKYCQQKFVRFEGDVIGNLKSSLVAGSICSISMNPFWVVFTRY